MSDEEEDSRPGGRVVDAIEKFIGRLDEQEAPATAYAAETAGPWRVREVEGGFAVLRASATWPEQIVATFVDRELAHLAAALLPATGTPERFSVAAEAGEDGYAFLDGREVRGVLLYSDSGLAEAMSDAHAVLCRPEALAHLLLAAGERALELALEAVRQLALVLHDQP